MVEGLSDPNLNARDTMVTDELEVEDPIGEGNSKGDIGVTEEFRALVPIVHLNRNGIPVRD